MLLNILSLTAFVSLVNAHGYISQAKSDLVDFTKAQKSFGAATAWREVSDNTGWIGSNFLNQKGIVCGASNTPRGTVAAPSGKFFSDASQTASEHMAVKAGGTFTVVVSGNPGEGFPHPKGHIQTYLADCGDSCVGKDVSGLNFFKIQSEKNGIQNTLRAGGVNQNLDGHVYNIDIPANLPSSKYILRYELIAFGQSSSQEGNQDQYYPFCAQIDLQGGSSTTKVASLSTVKFPGAYENGNIDQNTTPGPAVLSQGSSVVSSSASAISNSVAATTTSSSIVTSATASPSGSVSTNSTSAAGNQSSADNDNDEDCTDETDDSDSSAAISLPTISNCANTCLSVKFSEASALAPSCSSSDKNCFCSTKNFVGAFAQCLKDNCPNDVTSAVAALNSSCGTSATKKLARSLTHKQKGHAGTIRSLASHSKRAHVNSHRVKRSKIVDTGKSIFENVVVRRYARSGPTA